MRQFQAFLKKEWMEQVRSNRFAILLVIFLLFGVLSPALAKLTPWLFSMLSQDLEQQGIVFTEMNVDALTSWMQFYKNITLLLIVMVVMLCTTLSNELQKGTLVNMITKGLARWKVLLAKESMMMFLWTIAYGLCFVVTTLYTAYFWDNSIAVHFVLAGLCIWVFGLWLIASILFFSSFVSSSTAVLLGVGCLCAISYLCGLFPTCSELFPTYLLSAFSILTGELDVLSFLPAVCSCAVLILVEGWVAVLVFNKRKL